jgi:CheY-like chemotaxis protein
MAGAKSRDDVGSAKYGKPLATVVPEAHILLVEDNPMVQEVVLMMLARRPWLTTTAGSGRDAVQKWQAGHIDLILMDLQMPDMDGLEATRQIRQLEAGKGKKVGIIGLTAHASRAIQQECLDAGMNDVLVKPFEGASLYAAIERCLAD